MKNSDNDWYEVFGYMRKKMIYSHIYPSTYVHTTYVHMLLPKHVFKNIRDENGKLIFYHVYQLSTPHSS